LTRAAAALAALFLLAGCGGGDDEGPVAPWTGPQQPLPSDGRVPLDAFEAWAQSVEEEWERSPAGVASAFVPAGSVDGRIRVATANGASADEATAIVTVDRLADDSVRLVRYELELERRDDDTWSAVSATWAQRCQPGRGHQELSAELCV
jgi:hypothetical protein